MSESAPREGMLAALRGLLSTGLETLHVRLALLGTELEEERLRLLRLLLFGAIAFFLLGAGMVFLAAWLTVLLWDAHPLLVLAVLACLFLGGGLLALRQALRVVRGPTRLFAASLAEIAKDLDALEP